MEIYLLHIPLNRKSLEVLLYRFDRKQSTPQVNEIDYWFKKDFQYLKRIDGKIEVNRALRHAPTTHFYRFISSGIAARAEVFVKIWIYFMLFINA